MAKEGGTGGEKGNQTDECTCVMSVPAESQRQPQWEEQLQGEPKAAPVLQGEPKAAPVGGAAAGRAKGARVYGGT